MHYGYIRVSTKDQNLDRQLAELEGLQLKKVYADKLSGKNMERPQLQALLDQLREGDSVTILSLDRLGRNCDDILDIGRRMKESGAILRCLSPAFTTENMFGEFFMQIIGAISELERKQILERQRQGIALAKQLGKYKGRKPKALPDFEKVYRQWCSGAITSEQAGKLLGVSRATFYRRTQVFEQSQLVDFGGGASD